MSERYEGIVFTSTDASALDAFRHLNPPFALRLVHLADRTFGVYRVAARAAPFNMAAMRSLAAALSESTSAAVAVFYDNSCGIRAATTFRGGTLSAEFGSNDEWCVPLTASGELQRDAPPLAAVDLDTNHEYECVRDAIEAGLSELNVDPEVTRKALKDAFCYERSTVLAELGV